MKGTILRGKLLKLLKDVYPDGMEEQTIIGIYYQHNKVDDILTELAYLTDKGYVSQRKTPHPFNANGSICYYKILPQGIDLCEGTLPGDPAILLQVEA